MDYILERVRWRTNFVPGGKYKLNVRRPHSPSALRKLRRTHPEFFEDDGLLTRIDHWENYQPLHYVSLPRRHDAPRGTTAIEDLRDKDDFAEWFLDRFPDLPDGVYSAIRRGGGNRGYCTLFVLKQENGRVTIWKKKSNGSGNISSRYFALPLFFKLRQDLGI